MGLGGGQVLFVIEASCRLGTGAVVFLSHIECGEG
jgi:hypothetical protein